MLGMDSHSDHLGLLPVEQDGESTRQRSGIVLEVRGERRDGRFSTEGRRAAES
jgi:hypothetical protein